MNQPNPDNVTKAFGLPESIDATHEYVYRTGRYDVYDYWYLDNYGNYWLYTNAPEDHEDYDPLAGEAILVADQPMPHTAPQFYTDVGRKLHVAVPPDAELTENEAYDPLNARSIWYAMYESDSGETRFVYYDADVRENLDLWVQYQLRLTDALLVKYRKYASKLFESQHPKDKIVGLILALADQGCFEPAKLVEARVSDVEYTDMTIHLLGRKIVCDPELVDLFTSLTANRDPEEPLFVFDTVFGRKPIGKRHMYSIFKSLKIDPAFLLYWHASHIYSRIVHRLAANNTPPEHVDDIAFTELAASLGTVDDVRHLVDFQLQQTLRRNYQPLDDEPSDLEQQFQEPEEGGEEDQAPEEEVEKSLKLVQSDNFGVIQVWSDLSAKRPDEFEFSAWLHATPMHDVSEEEMEAIEEEMAQSEEEEESDQATPAPDEAGQAVPGDTEGQQATEAPEEGAPVEKSQPFDQGFTRAEAKRAADEINLDFSKEEFGLDQLVEGMNIEREHANITKTGKGIAKIALAHLKEAPDYYKKLKKVEN